MNKVKYRVTSMVGNFSRGDVVDVILYLEGCDNESVIVHPAEDGFDACLEIVVKGSDGIYQAKSEDSWMNLPKSFAYETA